MIDSFSGAYHFLSNFSAAEVWLDGMSFPTVEHAYQAAKTFDIRARVKIQHADTPNEAKKLGRKVTLREDWEEVKDEVMYKLLRQKFSQHPTLSQQLVATGDQQLMEGNWWGDRYWGVCRGQGKNMLGVLLMQVRTEIAPKVLEAQKRTRCLGDRTQRLYTKEEHEREGHYQTQFGWTCGPVGNTD